MSPTRSRTTLPSLRRRPCTCDAHSRCPYCCRARRTGSRKYRRASTHFACEAVPSHRESPLRELGRPPIAAGMPGVVADGRPPPPQGLPARGAPRVAKALRRAPRAVRSQRRSLHDALSRVAGRLTSISGAASCPTRPDIAHRSRDLRDPAPPLAPPSRCARRCAAFAARTTSVAVTGPPMGGRSHRSALEGSPERPAANPGRGGDFALAAPIPFGRDGPVARARGNPRRVGDLPARRAGGDPPCAAPAGAANANGSPSRMAVHVARTVQAHVRIVEVRRGRGTESLLTHLPPCFCAVWRSSSTPFGTSTLAPASGYGRATAQSFVTSDRIMPSSS